MNKEIENKVDSLIRKCHWRVCFHRTHLCAGNCGICEDEIVRGRCPKREEFYLKIREIVERRNRND